MRSQRAADKATRAAASNPIRSGAVHSVPTISNAISASAMPGKPSGLTQQNTAPTAPPKSVETLRSAIPAPLPVAAPVLAPVLAPVPVPVPVPVPEAPAISAPVAVASPVASAAPVVLAKVALSGRVRLSSGFGGESALENVQVSAEGAQCSATDSQGRFNCVAPTGWSGRVSPRRNNYRFAPSSLSFQNLRANADGQDFAAFYDPR
jgi:hypothetical protein